MPKYKIAVITPYYKEPTAMLRQAHDSVVAQGVDADHFFIADGFPNPEVASWNVNHVVLPRAHGDNGNTPRGIGSALADVEGYDFIAYLDADNWFHGNHLKSLVELYEKTGTGICASFRTICTMDGEDMGIAESEEVKLTHVDTSCLLIHRSSFEVTDIWLKMPKRLSAICDRIFLRYCAAKRYPWVSTQQRTVAFRSQYANHYQASNRPIPPGAKGPAEIRPSHEFLQSAVGVRECIARMGFWPGNP